MRLMGLTEFTNIKHKRTDFGCMMLYFNFKNDEWNKTVLPIIKDDDVYIKDNKFGYETEPHVTILFGLWHELISDGEIIADVREQMKKITFELKNISVFKHDNFDVVKFDIDSPKLTKLHEYFKNKYKHTLSFPEYHPHSTIAHVKPGRGAKYKQVLEQGIKAYGTKAVYSKPGEDEDGGKNKLIIDL